MSHSNSSGTLGTIEEITEEPAGRTIYRGSRDIGRDDIEITEIPALLDRLWPRTDPKPRILSAIEWVLGEAAERLVGSREELNSKQYSKRIHLQGNFYFDLAKRPVRQREDLTGFGMVARHEMMPIFSWEWFVVDGREHATKFRKVASSGSG